MRKASTQLVSRRRSWHFILVSWHLQDSFKFKKKLHKNEHNDRNNLLTGFILSPTTCSPVIVEKRRSPQCLAETTPAIYGALMDLHTRLAHGDE